MKVIRSFCGARSIAVALSICAGSFPLSTIGIFSLFGCTLACSSSSPGLRSFATFSTPVKVRFH
jgi:hypothetical protein